MNFNFGSWNFGNKTIFVSACLAVVSLFFNWVDIGLAAENGFGQGALLYLLVFVYPFYRVVTDKPAHKIAAYTCAVIGVILGIQYISSKSANFFGTHINAASTGPYVFIVACVLLAFGVSRSTKS